MSRIRKERDPQADTDLAEERAAWRARFEPLLSHPLDRVRALTIIVLLDALEAAEGLVERAFFDGALVGWQSSTPNECEIRPAWEESEVRAALRGAEESDNG